MSYYLFYFLQIIDVWKFLGLKLFPEIDGGSVWKLRLAAFEAINNKNETTNACSKHCTEIFFQKIILKIFWKNLKNRIRFTNKVLTWYSMFMVLKAVSIKINLWLSFHCAVEDFPLKFFHMSLKSHKWKC